MNDMRLSKDAAARAAGRLTAVGEDLEGKWKSTTGRITSLAESGIWGTDEGGQKAYAAYNQAAPKLLENAGELVQSTVRLGPTVQQAVAGLLTADEMSAKLLGQSGGDSGEGGAGGGTGGGGGSGAGGGGAGGGQPSSGGAGPASGGGGAPSSRPGFGMVSRAEMTTTVTEVTAGKPAEGNTVASFVPAQAGYASGQVQAQLVDGPEGAVFTPGQAGVAPEDAEGQFDRQVMPPYSYGYGETDVRPGHGDDLEATDGRPAAVFTSGEAGAAPDEGARPASGHAQPGAGFSPGEAGPAPDQVGRPASGHAQPAAVFTPGEGGAASGGVAPSASGYAQSGAGSSPGVAEFSTGQPATADAPATPQFFEALTGMPFDGQPFSVLTPDAADVDPGDHPAPVATSPFLPPDHGSGTPSGNRGG